ncbi:MAG: hypothetical protein AB7L09_03215 [Nitrospira sp.]
MVKALKLRAGTKNQPIVTLDDIVKLEDGYSVNLHMFNLRGTKDNIVVCPKTAADPRPCPVCEALNKDPTWYVVLTGIDRSKYTFERTKDNKKSSVTYTDLRRLILVTQTWLQRMTANAREKSFRGALFLVNRSEPETKRDEQGREFQNWKDSPRIGDIWYRDSTLDEEQLTAEFEQRAADYGLPVEKFVATFDYDVLLKPKSHDQLEKIAADIKNDGSALKDDDNDGETVGVSTSNDPEAEINY